MTGALGGGGGGKGGGSSSGGTTGADIGMTRWALGQNEQAIHNRYSQLGIGVPGGGQSAAQAAAGGGNLTSGGPSTMEQMDIGTIPTETGGAIGMADALVGELFNPTAAAGLGPTGSITQLQQLAGQQENAGFAAATGGGGGAFGTSSTNFAGG